MTALFLYESRQGITIIKSLTNVNLKINEAWSEDETSGGLSIQHIGQIACRESIG